MTVGHCFPAQRSFYHPAVLFDFHAAGAQLLQQPGIDILVVVLDDLLNGYLVAQRLADFTHIARRYILVAQLDQILQGQVFQRTS